MANFVRRCECGRLVRIPNLKEPGKCECGRNVALKAARSEPDQPHEEVPVTITPVVS